MIFKLILMLCLALALAFMIGATVVAYKRVARNRAARVRQLNKLEWSSTEYGCAESRAEF